MQRFQNQSLLCSEMTICIFIFTLFILVMWVIKKNVMGQKRTLLLNPTKYTQLNLNHYDLNASDVACKTDFNYFFVSDFCSYDRQPSEKEKNLVKPRHKACKEAGQSEWKTLYRVNSHTPVLFFNRAFNLNSHFWNFQVLN